MTDPRAKGRSSAELLFPLFLSGLFLLGAGYGTVESLIHVASNDGDGLGALVFGGVISWVLLLLFLNVATTYRLARRARSDAVPDAEEPVSTLNTRPPDEPLRIGLYDRSHGPAVTEGGRRVAESVVRAYRRGARAAAIRLALILGATWIARSFSADLVGAVAPGPCIFLFLVLLIYGAARRAPSLSVAAGWMILDVAALVTSAVMAASAAVRVAGGGDSAGGAGWSLATIIGGWVAYAAVTQESLRIARERAGTARAPSLLLLWSFERTEREARMMSLLQWCGRSWRFLGNVRQLRGPGCEAYGFRETLCWLLGREEAVLIDSTAVLESRVRSFRSGPGGPGVPIHPVEYLTCTENTWKLAVRRLLEQSDVILMDLRSFRADSHGCAFELGQLLDRVPLRQFILAVDESTDMLHLKGFLEERWRALARDSPNRRPGTGPLQVYRYSRTLSDYVPDDELKWWNIKVLGISLHPRAESSLPRLVYSVGGGTDAQGLARLVYEAAGRHADLTEPGAL